MSAGAVWVQDQSQRQGRLATSFRQPAQRVDEADALSAHSLPPGRLPHDQASQVVDDGEDRQLFAHALHGFAAQHVHPHDGFQVRQIGFDLLPLAVQFRHSLGGILVWIDERGDECQDSSSTPLELGKITQFSQDDLLWQSLVSLPTEPARTTAGLAVFDHLVVLAQLAHQPAGRMVCHRSSGTLAHQPAIWAKANELPLMNGKHAVQSGPQKQG